MSRRKGNSFHARKPKTAVSQQNPADAAPAMPAGDGHKAPSAAQASYSAPTRIQLCRSSAADAVPQAERARFEALRADLAADSRAEGVHELRLVDQLALAWWKLDRISTASATHVNERLDAGDDLLAALKGSESLGKEEAHLYRILLRVSRNLEFLQRWRIAAADRKAALEERRLAARESRERAWRQRPHRAEPAAASTAATMSPGETAPAPVPAASPAAAPGCPASPVGVGSPEAFGESSVMSAA